MYLKVLQLRRQKMHEKVQLRHTDQCSARCGFGIAEISAVFVASCPNSVIETFTRHNARTIAKYRRIVLKAIVYDMEHDESGMWEEDMIGGPGIEVQVDESKFGVRLTRSTHSFSTNAAMKCNEVIMCMYCLLDDKVP